MLVNPIAHGPFIPCVPRGERADLEIILAFLAALVNDDPVHCIIEEAYPHKILTPY